MARSRNIKPSIMDNEELAELDPLTRLLFIYLWMLADRDGRLEDRPKRIAAQALPYDRDANIGLMLGQLDRDGFIKRYEASGIACIQICAFQKHQKPHGTEKDGELPDENGMFTVNTRGKNGYATGDVTLVNSLLTVKKLSDNALIPDSGFLIPDSLIPDCVCETPAHTQAVEKFREAMKSRPDLDPETVFQAWKAYYPAGKRTWDKWVKWIDAEKMPADKPPSAADPNSKASIVALGKSLGVPDWKEATEQFTTYAARVSRARMGITV